MLRHFRAPVRRRARGQALAEFALIVPIFMLILGGVIQFGIIFWGQNTLNQVVRDAGRFAVTLPDCSDTSKTAVQTKVSSLASSMGAASLTSATTTMPTNGEPIGGVVDPQSDKNGTVTPGFCPPASNKDHVWIRITANAQVPIFFPGIGSGSISSTALFRMEPVAP
jgi:Flp pilus assembly protein TadG